MAINKKIRARDVMIDVNFSLKITFFPNFNILWISPHPECRMRIPCFMDLNLDF